MTTLACFSTLLMRIVNCLIILNRSIKLLSPTRVIKQVSFTTIMTQRDRKDLSDSWEETFFVLLLYCYSGVQPQARWERHETDFGTIERVFSDEKKFRRH